MHLAVSVTYRPRAFYDFINFWKKLFLEHTGAGIISFPVVEADFVVLSALPEEYCVNF